MEHKNYLVYFDIEDISPEKKFRELETLFGSGNVRRLNTSSTFVIKVTVEMSFSKVQDSLGLSNEGKIRGIIVDMASGYRNGWYSRDFWDFLSTPTEENDITTDKQRA